MGLLSFGDIQFVQTALDRARREQAIRFNSIFRTVQIAILIPSAFGCWIALRNPQLLTPWPFIVFFMAAYSVQHLTMCLRVLRLAEALERGGRTNPKPPGKAEPGAAPTEGPTEPLGNSGVGGGPPLVS